MICTPAKAVRAVLYARYSPRPDAKTSESNAAQFDSMRAAIVARGGRTIVATFEDADAHGDDAERPGLWAAVAALRRGDELWIDDPKRLARDLMLGEVIRKEVASRGATVVSVKMATDSTLEGEMVRKILAVIAEYEKKANAMLTASRMRRHQSTGRRMSAALPYGMMADHNGPSILGRDGVERPARMIPNPDEQPTVARILAMAAAGKRPPTIKAILEGEGVLCRGKATWNRNTIQGIIDRGISHPTPS